MQKAAELPKLIQAAVPTIERSVPPFAALLERIQRDYASFGFEAVAEDKLNNQAALVCQLKMIEWYVDKGQTVQALSMSREWLPSLLCFHFNLDPNLEKPNRDEMEFLLSGGKDKDRVSIYLSEWKEIPKKSDHQSSICGEERSS